MMLCENKVKQFYKFIFEKTAQKQLSKNLKKLKVIVQIKLFQLP